MAVLPIAMPVSIRRTVSLGIMFGIGEFGCQSRIVMSPAELIKRPSSAASQRYSGQWSRRVRIITHALLAIFLASPLVRERPGGGFCALYNSAFGTPPHQPSP